MAYRTAFASVSPNASIEVFANYDIDHGELVAEKVKVWIYEIIKAE
jgi:hypothetical protein